MSQKDKNIKKVRKMLIITFIILLILTGIMCAIFFSDVNVAKREVTRVNSLEKDYSDYIMPSNRNALISNYSGSLSRETLYTLLYEFSLDVLPELRKKGTHEIEKYFEDNKEYIYIKTGIEDLETYKAFINKIKDLPEELILSKTEIKQDSVVKENTYVTAVLIIYYNDSANQVEIDIKVENRESTNRTSIIFN